MVPPRQSDQARRLRNIARFFGLAESAIQFATASESNDIGEFVGVNDGTPRMIEFPAHKTETPSACRDFFPSGVPPGDLFLFGSRLCAPEPGPASHGQTPVRACEIRFADDDLWGALQGLTVNWPLNLKTFSPSGFTESGGWKSLLTVNGTPWFLVRKSPHGTVFLWISPELPDIKLPLSPNDLIHKERIISRKLAMLPLFVFSRHSFGSKIWHAPVPYANLIIDDPPVSERYGFFSPARHLAALADLFHSTTVAYIPWNWRRSSIIAAEIFRSNQDKLSLCVHGCDHTQWEFATSDHAVLSAKCRLALHRVEKLRQLCGVSCAPVMIFPQGRFSLEAIAALQETGFQAAVNTTRFPVDLRAGDICMSDLIGPVITRFGGFPLFRRRYPRDPALSALDLFIGMPALFVEHHAYFKDDYAACRQFITAINQLQCHVVWAPLDQIVSRVCLQRVLSPECFEVIFYTRDFILENPSKERRTYQLQKRDARSSFIENVLVDGSPVTFNLGDGQLSLTLQLAPQASATIHLRERAVENPSTPAEGSPFYRLRVWARRMFCGVRDNNSWIFYLSELFKDRTSKPDRE